MTEPCIHLEKLISVKAKKDPQFESVNRYAGNNVDKVAKDFSSVESYETDFIRRLQLLPLPEIQVSLLVFRYVYDKSFKQIRELLKIPSVTTTIRLHNDALAILRKKWRGSNG